MTERSNKLIYFAGPLFTQGERSWNAEIARNLESAGYSVLLPQVQADQIVKAGGGLTDESRAKLFRVAIDSIDRADAVVAILDGPDADSGTCFECGYAYAKGKPVLGVRTDLRLGGDDVEQGVNLMLSQSCKSYKWIGLAALGKEPDFAAEEVLIALESMIRTSV